MKYEIYKLVTFVSFFRICQTTVNIPYQMKTENLQGTIAWRNVRGDSAISSIAQNATEKPYDQFTKHVAAELLQLPQRAAISMQHDIHNCVTLPVLRFKLFN